MGRTRRLLAGAAILAGVTGGASAQDARPPCVLDRCLGLKPADAARSDPMPQAGGSGPDPSLRGARAPGTFDFYVLALSWSPGFCSTGGDRKAPAQCAPGRGLGFVVHGLWPQYTRGFPSACGPAGRVPSRQALEMVQGLYPDQGLARYEWTKHGTCSGKSPTDYFADVRRAREGIAIPEPLRAPRQDQTWAPIDIARAFAAVNAGLRPNAMAVTCRQGILEEVRICLSKDLRSPVTCPEVARASCRIPQMNVPGLR